MRRYFLGLVLAFVCAVGSFGIRAQSPSDNAQIPTGAKIFIAPMNGFETYITAGLRDKKVPLVIVTDREKAEFEITGTSDSQKPGWAKTIFMSQHGTDEQASISVVNIKTSVVAFAYSVNKGNSVHGKQSAAEACAKHLKAHMEGKD
jgi:hypothetical protein